MSSLRGVWFLSVLLIAASANATELRYTKLTGTFLMLKSGRHFETGTSYTRQVINKAQNEIMVETHSQGKTTTVHFELSPPDFLEFSARSIDSQSPALQGRFLNTNYDECFFFSNLPAQNAVVSGALTKIDADHAISTKTVTSKTGEVLGILQDRIEVITKQEFESHIEDR